jgi:transglutaminase-like putative cysteine protease
VRRLVAALGPGIVLALLWGTLERPVDVVPLVTVVLLGVAPATVRRIGLRLVAAAAALVGGLSVAFAQSPAAAFPRTPGTWVGELATRAEAGLRDFETTALPFEPAVHAGMDALVLTAVLCVTLAAALAVSFGRPLLAGAAVVIGGGWATASLTWDRPLAAGSVLLAGVLWPAAALRVRTRVDGVAALGTGSAVVAVGVVVAALGVAPASASLEWRDWSLLGSGGKRTSVRFVWNAGYDGIDFPPQSTVVFRVRGPERAHYWRASTLDLFTGGRWVEALTSHTSSGTRVVLPPDPLLPKAASDPSSWFEQRVEIRALEERRLLAAGQPMEVRGDELARVLVLGGGVIAVPAPLPRGATYSVWSFASSPGPKELARSRPRYPRQVERYLALERWMFPGFGTQGRDPIARRLFAESFGSLPAFRDVYDVARRLTAEAAGPYEAALAIETWLRLTGGFRYDEQPPRVTGEPLARFVLDQKRGYCQHFAGAMALMLRMLGVPARVAVGFTSGKKDEGDWIVSDTDAHAWVEAWFDGYGWLPFDPTPGRGTFTASYTVASDSPSAARALGRGAIAEVPPATTDPGTTAGASRGTRGSGGAEDGSLWPLWLVVFVVAPVTTLAAAKAGRRRRRYATRDPRRRASAARAELLDVLRDQGLDLPDDATAVTLESEVARRTSASAEPFLDAHAQARYGPPDGAAAAADEALAELRALRAALRRDLGLERRVRGFFSVRSLRPWAAPR